MPKIIINEIDNTNPGLPKYANFTVLVPGFSSKLTAEDEAVELNSVEDFETIVGKSAAYKGSEGEEPVQMGNQIAYELLKLGYKVIYKSLGNVIDEEVEAAVAKLASSSFWKDFEDKGTYDFRYIINGLLSKNTDANETISAIAKERGDCIALVDIDETNSSSVELITEEVAKLVTADKYTAIFAPSIYYKMTKDEEFEGNVKFPASFHYLACAAEAAEHNFAEWYAVAGFTRGISSRYIIEKTSTKFGEVAVNLLAPRNNEGINKAVNLVAKIKNHYYLWGNRTAEGLTVNDLIASHFLNIRQLCTTLKKQIYIACKRLTFDPNSSILWINFKDAITPTLDRMKADQGITDYDIIKVPSSRKAEFKARIRIIPIEAVEDFEIDLSLEDSLGNAEMVISERA